MSERWGFCSEFIYCVPCRDAVHKAMRELYGVGDDEMTPNLRSWVTIGAKGPIVAGYGGGLSSADSRATMKELCDLLKGKLCHPVRWAALYDDDTQEFIRMVP